MSTRGIEAEDMVLVREKTARVLLECLSHYSIFSVSGEKEDKDSPRFIPSSFPASARTLRKRVGDRLAAGNLKHFKCGFILPLNTQIL